MYKLFLLFFLISSVNAETEKEWTLVIKKGDIQVLRNDEVVDTATIKKNDEIRTKDKSLAILKGPGEIIKIGPNSILKVEDFSPTQSSYFLEKGEIQNKITKKSFIIKSFESSLGVRGTQFFVAVSDKKKVWMCVNEGTVSAQGEKGKEVLVNAGEGINIEAGNVSKPQKYDWVSKINWQTDSKDFSLPENLFKEKNTGDYEF